MSESISRTPALIAAEINTLKEQGRAVLLSYSIEIGRRLAEARQLISHGGWGDWLRENVAYKSSTANNLIRVYERFGDRTAALTGEANHQALGDLDFTYTQAVALLALPEEECADFIAGHDVASMSTRELQQAIRERDEAIKRAEEAETQMAEAQEAAQAAQISLDGQQGVVSILEGQKRTLLEEKQAAEKEAAEQIDRLARDKAAADARANSMAEEIKTLKKKPSKGADHARIQELEEKLAQAEANSQLLQNALEEAKATKPDVEATYAGVEPVVPPEVQQELETLRSKQAIAAEAARFRAAFELVTDTFGKLVESLQALPEEDQPRYRKPIEGLLERMGAKIGQVPTEN